MLRTFSPEKIWRLRPGANPQSWVPEASMLTTRPQKPLAHYYCLQLLYCCQMCLHDRYNYKMIPGQHLLYSLQPGTMMDGGLPTILNSLSNFMFCWPYIQKYACNETNLMHCLSSVYWVTTPLHVLGLLVAHHEEVTMYICGNWYVLYILVDCRQAWMECPCRLRCTTRTNCHIYTLLPPDEGQLASLKHVEGIVTE
jgi:hypothetical protein